MKIVDKARYILLAAVAATLAGCTTVRESNPPRTAMEELLISSAADRAAARLTPQVPKGSALYVDASTFDGTDAKYAIGAIRGRLLMLGYRLAGDKKAADVIVEIRAGALSTDTSSTLIGLPSFTVPIPFASTGLTTPELALYKDDDQKGVAKMVADTYYAAKGPTEAQQQADFGFAHNTKHTILLFISWTHNDVEPDEDDLAAQNVVTSADTGR